MIGSASNINSFQNVFGVQKGLSPNQLASALKGQDPATGADLLTLSPTANMLQQFLSMDVQNEGRSAESDLTGLEQLKQRGEMLSNILQMKLKNFESNLITSMKSAGVDPSQTMEMKAGDNGPLLMNDMPNKEAIQNLLKNNDSLNGQFQEISNMAGILGMLQQLGNSTTATANGLGGFGSAAQYARQTQAAEKRPEAEFVLRVMQGSASYTGAR